MLDLALKDQLRGIFAVLVSEYILDITVSSQHESRGELIELLEDVADCSDKISCRVTEGDGLAFVIRKNDMETGICFRAVPNGHEFTSLLLAILNLDGKGKNFPDNAVCRRVEALKSPLKLTTYES